MNSLKTLPLAAALVAAWCQLAAEVGPLELWFNSPADFSTDVTSTKALPIGNGKMAAMIFGGVGTEIVQFNEDTIWMGTVHDYSRAGAYGYLEGMRNAIWQGEGQKAYSDFMNPHFMSDPMRQSPYAPGGELRISTGHSGSSNYRRSLDLETAISTVQYDSGGVTYTRETFASYPDRVIVARFSASTPGSVNLGISLTTPHSQRQVVVDGEHLVLDASVNKDADTRRQQVSDIEFQARVDVRAEGGQVSYGSSSVTVTGADSVVLVLHVATNFVRFDDLSADPSARAVAALEAVDDKSYEDLLADHLADYQELFGRVVLDLGTTSAALQPTDTRRANLKTAIDVSVVKNAYANSDPDTFTSNLVLTDPQLVTLNFQMGRYLIISGSRPGSQPLNLQGKWNNQMNPPWESKMTLNINQEMNYWGAEITNLGESHEPMVDMVEDLSQTGALVAQTHYNAGGWVVHHNTDLWRAAAPINNAGGMWPTGAAWLSMHLWWHYRYSMDPAVLERIYPLMKSASQFFVDTLVMDPRSPSDTYAPWNNTGHPQWGQYLLTNPTHSPEHQNYLLEDNGDNGDLVAGTTMDSQLIRGLFNYVIEAGELLGEDDTAFRDTLAEKRDLLPPNQIGRLGQIQEWLEDVDEANGHRHISHLVDLYPGDAIHPVFEPELTAAAKVSLDWKGDDSNTNTSWSRAWKMNLRTALGAGDHAFMILCDLIGRGFTDNLTFQFKNSQIDGNLGSLSGTAQFFMQSRRGIIELLPALPALLPDGSINGLRAMGGFEVGISWAEGKLAEATILAENTGTCQVRCATAFEVADEQGFLMELTHVAEDIYSFEAQAGATYSVVPEGTTPVSTWQGWHLPPDGMVDTGEFLGWVYAGLAPYAFWHDAGQWFYAPEGGPQLSHGGGWIFLYRQFN